LLSPSDLRQSYRCLMSMISVAGMDAGEVQQQTAFPTARLHHSYPPFY